MGVVSHRYGDFFHHFAGKLAIAARAGWQGKAAPWLGSVSVEANAEGVSGEKAQPSQRAPVQVVLWRVLLLSREAHLKHLLTLPTLALQQPELRWKPGNLLSFQC